MEVKSYDLSLEVDFAALSYTGRVTISLEKVNGEVALNALGLKILSASSGGKSLTWEERAPDEEILLHGVPAGKSQVILGFEGKVSDGTLVGFYKSRFDAGYILTTQFEATQARRLFPCIDHPAYKAVFNVEVAVDNGLGVIFNTPAASEARRPDGRKVFKFGPTPKMSTYLLYLGIGGFAERERIDGNLKVIVAMPEEKKAMADYALDHGARMVRFFERYFGIPYPLPKLHLIAIPDTWVGGMENWGAITFREMALLVDEGSSTQAKKQVVQVLAHEIAHQWFGDLVTMSWWNDIWLNESFATFMTHKAIEELHPESETWNDFLFEDVARAFLWDALTSTHPIEANVVKPSDIDEAFDEISYEKGASVLRMIEAYVGEEGFRNGVTAYLNRFRYGNASGGDLWKALEEVTHVPIPTIMDHWIKREGYPVLSIHAEGSKLTLRQERFTLGKKEESQPWPLPVSLRINGDSRRLLLEEKTLTIDAGKPVKEVVANLGRTGFYRVRYSPPLMVTLTEQFPTLKEAERWGLVQDLFASFISGTAEIEDYLAIVQQSYSDPSRLVTMEISGELATLLPLVHGNAMADETIRTFAEKQMHRIGARPRSGEPEPIKALRERLALLRTFCDEEFAKSFSKEFPGYDTADPDLRAPIAVAYAMFGGKKEHAELVKRFQNAPTEMEAFRISEGLLSFRQEDLLMSSLNLAFDKETGLGKGLTLVQAALSLATRTPEARATMWKWFSQNLDTLVAVTKGSSLLSLLLQYYLPRGGLGREPEVKTFMEARTIPGGESGKTKGLELLSIYEKVRKAAQA